MSTQKQSIKRGTLGKIIRFLKPIKYKKLEYSKEIFKALLIAINGVIHILFLEHVVKNLEVGNGSMFFFVLKIYALYIFSFEISHFLMRKWGWMNTLPYTDTFILKEYLSSYISMNNNKIELIGTGKLVGLIKEGVYVWVEMIADVIEKITVLLVTVIFSFYMVSRLNIYYGLVFIVLFILFFFIAVWANTKLIKYRAERYEVKNERLRQFVKIIMSKIEILQTGKIDSEIQILYENSCETSRISRNMAFHRTIMRRTAPFTMSLIILGIFFVLGQDALNGDLNLGLIVGLSGTFIIMQKAIADILAFYVNISKKFVAIEKVWDFLDFTPQIQGYEQGDEFVYKKGDIFLKNINYSYDGKKQIFEDFSIDIEGEKITAFVGPSGGGKSTLVKLVSAYIRPDNGDIIVDNQKLSGISLKSYYKDIGYLTQEPSVFDGSVRENLLYAVGDSVDDEQIAQVIELAHCEFIYDLPEGLDSEIGERGIKLSGGQKQRLAIAKIFLKNPKIIILDEPTSALDSVSEKKITQAMHNLFQKRTVLVIAHRLQTVKHADDIVVIENGKIIERGTHTGLIRKKGFYKQMLDLQSGF